MIDTLTAPLTWPGFGEVTLLALLALCAASLLAGAVDAIVGGGGLVQLSALLVVLPGGEAIFSVATNKLASVVGTASAAITFARRVPIDRRHAVPMAVAAFAGAIGGALLAAALPSRVLTVIVLVALVGVGIYTWRRPELGAVHAPRFARRTQGVVMVVGGAAIGFYDGLAGPGPARSSCSCWSGWSGSPSCRPRPRRRSSTPRRTSARWCSSCLRASCCSASAPCSRSRT